jgi:L-threonylcarbamoyladenylate synthase
MTDTPSIDDAVKALRTGGLVAFPTETVYGLGADARSPEAIARIYALKGRPSNHPVIVHLADLSDIGAWAVDIPPAAWRLAERVWPGPLTMILRRAPGVSEAVTGGQDSVGIRIPSHPVAQALLRAFGGGIAAPSANRYGRISPTEAAHVREEFGPDSPLILEGGACEVGLESTIVSLVDEPLLLRPGAVDLEHLEAVLGPVRRARTGEGPRAPGTTVAHYAPRTPVRLVSAHELASGVPPGAAVYARGERPPGHRGVWLEAPDDPVRYGHDLYARMRDLDRVGAPLMVIETVPESAPWDAVRDRLGRAAAACVTEDLA